MVRALGPSASDGRSGPQHYHSSFFPERGTAGKAGGFGGKTNEQKQEELQIEFHGKVACVVRHGENIFFGCSHSTVNLCFGEVAS